MHTQDYLISLVDQMKHADVFSDPVLIALSSVSSCTKISRVGGNDHSCKTSQCIRGILWSVTPNPFHRVLNAGSVVLGYLLGLIMAILCHFLITYSLPVSKLSSGSANLQNIRLWLEMSYVSHTCIKHWINRVTYAFLCLRDTEVMAIMWPFLKASQLLQEVHCRTVDLCIRHIQINEKHCWESERLTLE